MRYRRFGKTNFSFSLFSLGTMRLASEEAAQQTIDRAITLGVNHLETARGYGKSEQYLGTALRSIETPRSQIYVTSKIPPTLDAEAFERSIDQSLEAIGVDHLDCLAVHGVNTEEHLSWIESPQGCMRAVERAIADGRVRQAGFSTHAPLSVILRAIETDRFSFVNLHYNYFFQRNAAAIERAHQREMGVFIISPADKGGMLYTPPPTLVELCQPFSPLELNYRFLLSDCRITTLSAGAAVAGELNVLGAIVDRDDPLTPEESIVLARLQTHQEQVLATDCCSQCYDCLPCPEVIHIPEVLRLRNLAVAYGMTAYGQYRYGMFENAGHWFPGRQGNRCTDCGDCLPRCPEQLDIPRLLRETHGRLKGESRRRLWD